MVSKQKQAKIRWWKKQSQDKNLGPTIREYYKNKLRGEGVKVD